MDKNNIEKYIFAGIFVVGCAIFSIMNLYTSKDDICECVKTAEVETITDVEVLIDDLDVAIEENVYQRNRLIELYGGLNRMLGKNEINGFEYVKDKNGYLTSGNFWAPVYDKDMQPLAIEVQKLYTELQKEDTQLIVVGCPQKYSKEWTEEYYGIPYNDSYYEMNMFMIQMRKYRIPNMDFQTILEDSDYSYDQIFYKTDHHWKTEASFYCYQLLMEEIEALGVEIDPDKYYRDKSNYTSIKYENLMLGSQGRSTGMNYAGVEDFELLYLKDDSVYEYYSTSEYGEKYYKGSIEDTLIGMNLPTRIEEDFSQIYEISLYDMYMRGIADEITVINKSNEEGPKVLFLRDSFADPIATYMAPACSRIDMLWTDHVTTERIWEYIDKNDYDIVILMYGVDDFNEDFIHFSKEE